MALNLEQKKSIISDVSSVAGRAFSVIAADYTGLTSTQMTNLRSKARSAGVYLRVVKNTLAIKAVEGTGFECMAPELTGQLVMGFATEDPGSVARIFKDFAKDNPKFVVKVVAIEGRLLTPEDIDRLASMPTKDQAISMLMSVIKAPVEKFVRTLAEPHAKLVRTVAAVRDQKEAV
jgi:large subunit ribosomal protein L10